MNVIVCVDDRGGMLFNNRRVSRDAALIEKICSMCRESTLWIRSFSEELFEGKSVRIDDECLDKAGDNDFCFIEDTELNHYINKIKKIFVCRWNRKYPYDFEMDIDLNSALWQKQSEEDIVGKSHEKITIEEYERVNNDK